jgi:Holliday junction resolvasome RuvABC ATP-dependent DNA helicase subunit
MPDTSLTIPLPSSTVNFHPVFNHVIGQDTAKSVLSLAIASADIDEDERPDLCQPIFLGEAGLGKTELAETYGKAIAARLGCDMIRIGTPKDVRNLAEFDPIFERIVDDEYLVLYIDECHELEPSKPAHAKLATFIRKALDRQNDNKPIQIADRVTVFNRKKKVIILSTNHADKMDTALMSRMQKINLVPYKMDEIRAITNKILEKNDITVDNQQTVDRIAICGRGTARPIVNLVQNSIIPMMKCTSSSHLNNNIVMEALKQNEMFPGGLTLPEVAFLLVLRGAPKNRLQILSTVTSLDGGFAKAAAYLQTHKLVQMQTNGIFHLTSKGSAYIKHCREELGFRI